MAKLSASILSADLSRLGEEARLLAESGCEYLHIDVMDGTFVPNLTFGGVLLHSLDESLSPRYDVHLMVEHPETYVDMFKGCKTEYLTVHYEAVRHLDRLIGEIKEAGIKAGVALNPATPPSLLQYVLKDLDLVLVMSVNPGFSGQHFLPGSLCKIKELASIREKYAYPYRIEVDGGVTKENAPALVEAGADILVSGSDLFGKEDRKESDLGQRVRAFKDKIG